MTVNANELLLQTDCTHSRWQMFWTVRWTLSLCLFITSQTYQYCSFKRYNSEPN